MEPQGCCNKQFGSTAFSDQHSCHWEKTGFTLIIKNFVEVWGSVQHMDRDRPCFMGHTSSDARNAQRPRAIKLIITNELLHFLEFIVRLSRNHLFVQMLFNQAMVNQTNFYVGDWRSLAL